MKLDVSAFLRPQIQWNGSQFVDQRIGKAIFCQIDGLDVSVTAIAAFHANMGHLSGRINRKFGGIFFPTSGTDDAPKRPFGQAKTAYQVTLPAVTLLTQHPGCRFAIAPGADRSRIILELQMCRSAGKLGEGLKIREGEKFLWSRSRRARPDGFEKCRLGVRRRLAQAFCELGQFFRAVLYCEVKEFSEFHLALRISPVQILLKPGHMDVKGEYFRCKGMRYPQLFCAPDSLLPNGISHALIIRLAITFGNLPNARMPI